MTREQWIKRVTNGIARTMPDEYPSDYARFLAEKRADEGGYDNYVAGRYGPDKLWEPEAVER